MHAITAGGRKKAAQTAVRPISSATHLQNQYISSFTGRRGRDAVVKAETRSPGPSAPKKRKIYSTTDANAIGDMDPIDVDFAPPQAIGKRNKTVASGSAHVEFDGIMLPPKQQPPGRPTRKSSRVSKATSKKNTRSELFTRLAQEFRALASTCEEIGEVLE